MKKHALTIAVAIVAVALLGLVYEKHTANKIVAAQSAQEEAGAKAAKKFWDTSSYKPYDPKAPR